MVVLGCKKLEINGQKLEQIRQDDERIEKNIEAAIKKWQKEEEKEKVVS